jgi:heme exporter protein B
MREFGRQVLTILWKDLLSEWHTKDIITPVLVFALLVIIIFNFAFQPGEENIGLVAPGVLWVAFTFAGILGLNRAFVLEKERGCLEGLMLCPVDREVIYLGKMLASFLFMFLVELISLPIFSAFLNLPLLMPRLILVAFLATIGFVAVGTIFSAMAVNTRAREIMLPILFFPIVVPVIIAAVKSSALIMAGAPWQSMAPWLQMMVAFDIIFLVVCTLTFEFVLEQ